MKRSSVLAQVALALIGLEGQAPAQSDSASTAKGPIVLDSHPISTGSRPPFTVSWSYADGSSGVLGSSWRCWPFDAAVQTNSEAKGNVATVFDSSGQKRVFVAVGTNVWLPTETAQTRRISLQKTSRGYVITDLLQGRQTYDPAGRLVEVSDLIGHRLLIVRDEKGRPTAVELNFPTKALYQIVCAPASGRLARIEAPDGRRWTYEYEGSGRLAKATDSTGCSLSYHYASGRLAERADSVGHWKRYRYDGEGRVVEVDRNGRKEKRAYSSLGGGGGDWMVTRTDALGRQSEYRFLPSKRQEVLREPDGNVVVRQYDERWRLEHVSSLKEGVTSFERDAAGRTVKVTNPRGRVTQIGYGGALGLPTTVVDGWGGIRKMAYNAHGQLTSERLPDGRERDISYNEAGRPAEMTDSEGGALRFEYDPAGKLEAVEGEAGRMETGARRQRARLGGFLCPSSFRLLPISEARVELMLRLDMAALPGKQRNSETADVEHRPLTLHIRCLDGSELGCSFDLFDNLTGLREKESPVATFRYDDGDRLLEIQYADKRSERFEYDVADRVVAYTDAAGKVFRYRYDAAGHLLRQTFPDGEENVFDYDADGRLVSGRNSSWHDLFVYDSHDRLMEVGRLTPKSKDPELLARYTYNGQSRVESQLFGDGLRVAHEYNTNNTLETIEVQGARIVLQKGKDGRCQRLFLPGGAKVEFGCAKDGASSRVAAQDNQGKSLLSQFGQFQSGRLVKVICKTPDSSREYEVGRGAIGDSKGAGNQQAISLTGGKSGHPSTQPAPPAEERVPEGLPSKPKDARNPFDAFGRLRVAESDRARAEFLYGLGGLMGVQTSGQRIRLIRSSDGVARALVVDGGILFLVPSLVPGEAFVGEAKAATLRPIRFSDRHNPEINIGKAGTK
jgi:YD repeat-containing protein